MEAKLISGRPAIVTGDRTEHMLTEGEAIDLLIGLSKILSQYRNNEMIILYYDNEFEFYYVRHPNGYLEPCENIKDAVKAVGEVAIKELAK